MIEKFTIKDFKSYKEADLHIAPLSILIGANASGKSNILEALRLFSLLAQGQRLSDLQYKINQEDKFLRGFINQLPRFGKEKFALGCFIEKDNCKYQLEIHIELRDIDDNYELHIQNESLFYNDRMLYSTLKKSEGKSTSINMEYNFTEFNRQTQGADDQKAVFTQLMEASFNDGYTDDAKTMVDSVKLFQLILSKIIFLNTSPLLMHGYSHKSDKKILESGRNISAVLYHLIKELPDNKSEILNFIESLPEQKFIDISFIETARGEVLVQLHEAFINSDKNIVDAGLLSDGTLRALAIAATLLSAEQGSLVIIEEIDNGIHPSRVKELIERINELAKRRGLSVLITSHNPTLLNASPKETVDNVQFCYRNKQDGSSKIIRIQEIKDYPELIAQDDLGNLLTRGLIDQYVKDETTEEEKVNKGLDWLKGFEYEQ